MQTIVIEQLDSRNQVFRTFTLHKRPHEVETVLDRIDRAYNMNRTRVTVTPVASRARRTR
jgi:hypothetical protein